ncbi:hypothetical protein SLNSH_24250 [Alsobacter soli]|uniref:DUF4426 domain-containing protein n=1 Tax=Alsobacter soli TaxID=2109933 RepID=A0A2T1HLA4_9HYPH|nr:hypothetical protein [Alsobacter soli]PSC02412.1 hypothetical protein SLNSH_24250 [Alsobacter soli]
MVSMVSRRSALILAARLWSFLWPARPHADVLEPYQKAGDLGVYLGIIPAQIARRHPSEHPEATMHGGPAEGRDMHVVVAIFDAAGNRVEDAEVSDAIAEVGQVGRRRARLEPMKIADTITFGAFVAMFRSGRQSIEVENRRPGSSAVQTASFTYDPGS